MSEFQETSPAAQGEPAGGHGGGNEAPQGSDVGGAVQTEPVVGRFTSLHAQGFSVIPLRVRGKTPDGQWKQYQTQRASLTDARRWDNSAANVGILTGEASGIIAVDFDTHAAFEDAQRRGLLPATPTVRTPRGAHAYFAYETGIRNAAGIMPGVDVRGEGGYVVAPGSYYEPSEAERVGGKLAGNYFWVEGLSAADLPPAPIPDALRTILERPSRPDRRVQSGATGDTLLDNVVQRVRDAANGERNETLNRETFFLAQRAASAGWGEHDVQQRLFSAAQEAGLPAGEADEVIDRAWRDGAAHPVTISPDDAEISQDFVATLFTDRYGDRFKHDWSVGKWFNFGTDHWQRNDTRFAAHLFRVLTREAGGGRARFANAGFVGGAETLARSHPCLAVTNEHWDNAPMLLGCPGVTVDLATGRVRPPDSRNFITKRTSVAPATGEPTRWKQFLQETTCGDVEMIRYLQQICGYFLTGDTREQALFFIFGNGGNGKSVFLAAINEIMGDYSLTAAMDTFAASKGERHSTDIARLDGARLVSASETEEGRTWAEARIKQMTGGDEITARFMRQDNFSFVPVFKLLIVGNHQPNLSQVDDAMRRRFNIIPFVNKPPVPDKLLSEKLKPEYGQILSWMIEGCRDWLANGLIRPASVVEATDDFFEGQDVFQQWLDEYCDVMPGKNGLRDALYHNWERFAHSVGEEPGTLRQFNGPMKKRGFRLRKRTTGDREKEFVGLGLRQVQGPSGDLVPKRALLPVRPY